MIKIEKLDSGKWKVTLSNGLVLNDKYSSELKAVEKLYKYLKGQK